LAWVLAGSRLLATTFRGFFSASVLPLSEDGLGSSPSPTPSSSTGARAGRHWLSVRWRCNLLWWVVGGYYVSGLAFGLADLAASLLLPAALLDAVAEHGGGDSVVGRMVAPEFNDLAAMAVAALAPCASAPWWEEVVYRGFLLPALACGPWRLPLYSAAVPVSALLFAAHHQSAAAALPLAALGAVWALLYLLSGNLAVPVLVHALWNSRVFLGSLLGL
jgi:membrane protease YdiL (CAAX protease family)